VLARSTRVQARVQARELKVLANHKVRLGVRIAGPRMVRACAITSTASLASGPWSNCFAGRPPGSVGS
jgi:hypothetical protein